MNGETLKGYRIALGMTQKELGQAIGMSSNQVARMERGERKILPRTIVAMRFLLQYRIALAITGNSHSKIDSRQKGSAD